MAGTDRVIADSEAVLRRISPDGRRLARRARERRFARRLRLLKRLAIAAALVVAGVFAWGLLVGPIGQMGLLLAAVVMLVAALLILFAGREVRETRETLTTSELPLLPGRTEAWLQARRPELPAPAQRLSDAIGARLEALAPQVASLDPADPSAVALRKLLDRELPELVDNYVRVPATLRARDDAGMSPDRQVVAGLKVVEQRLGALSTDLAAGDLHSLAVQGRYLELKYREEPPA